MAASKPFYSKRFQAIFFLSPFFVIIFHPFFKKCSVYIGTLCNIYPIYIMYIYGLSFLFTTRFLTTKDTEDTEGRR